MKAFKRLTLVFLAVFLIAAVLPIQGEAAEVKLNKTKAALYVGKSVTLQVKGTSAKAKWESSKKSVATVDSQGKVTAKKAGTAVITAKIKSSSFQCRITVKNPCLNKKEITLSKGKTFQLKITGTTAKSWKSNKPSVAAVNKNGKVTAKKAGTATITCNGKNGKSYKCKVKVKGKSSSGLSEEQVYKDMIAMKSKYPEGMSWTNDNYYGWKGGIYSGGYGCAGFAFAISDAAFGSLPARKHTDFSKIRVGDIVRMNYDSHSVIVLEVKGNGVVAAEGNYNRSVHWGRNISFSEIQSSGTYVMTRYPQ